MDVKVGGVTERGQIGTATMLAGHANWLNRAGVYSQQAANFVEAFLDPAALLALVFGLWRLGIDLGWTQDFVIAQGLFSHWQVWLALAIGIKMSGSLLKPAAVRKSERDHVA